MFYCMFYFTCDRSFSDNGRADPENLGLLLSEVVPDFGSGSGKSEIRPFSEIRPSPAPDKFLAGFAGVGGCQCSCSTFSYLRIKLMQLTCQVVHSQFYSVLPRRKLQNLLPFP